MTGLTYRNKPAFKIAMHFTVWLLLFVLPFLLSENTSFNLERRIKYTWIPLIYSAFLFYLNYFLLIDKFALTKKTWLFVIINLLLIAVIVAINNKVREFHFFNVSTAEHAEQEAALLKLRPSIQWIIYKDTIYLFFPIIISLALKITEKWAKTESEKNEREKETLNYELRNLKYQLQPHFFFNSLNTIYSLIESSPTVAQETVHSLSKLMRYLLYDTVAEKVDLANEIEFMKQYINLMKLRTSDKTTVRTEFPALHQQIKVAPLLFISLIENAFKHGISAIKSSQIIFDLKIEGSKVIFVAENTNFPKDEKDKSGSGIGLINLRKQLELSYPGKHKFQTSIINNITFKVLLEVDTN